MVVSKPFCSLIHFLKHYDYKLPKKHCIFGLDVGNKYIGFAMSDYRYRKALTTDICFIRGKNNGNIDEIRFKLNQMCMEYKTIALVVGVPTMSEQRVQDICNFMETLTQHHPSLTNLYNMPVLLQDETYSTFESYKSMTHGKEINKNSRHEIVQSMTREEKEELDRISATFILQRTLDDIYTQVKEHKKLLREQVKSSSKHKE